MEHKVELYEYSLADVRDIFNPSTFHPPGIALYFLKTKIPHTTIVVFDNEYQFGKSGIITERDFGLKPIRTETLGYTTRSKEDFEAFLKKLNTRKLYCENSYDLFNYNCLTFSNIICNFLCRRDIPDKFLNVIEFLRKLKVPQPVGKFLMGTN